MKSSKAVMCVALAAAVPLNVQAATAFRAAVINELQGTGKSAASDIPLMYVAQSGGWQGTVDCPTEWAYFNAADNPHFVATALAAGIADRVVRVYVDDTLPKVNGYCQVKFLSLLPAT